MVWKIVWTMMRSDPGAVAGGSAIYGWRQFERRMKTLLILTLVLLVFGCRPETPPGQNSGPSKPAAAGPVTYSDGDGSTIEKAVVIKGAKDEEAGVAAEYAWLRQKYPGYKLSKQSLRGSGDRHYDLIEIDTREGHKTIYFDITDFFGK